MSEHQILWPSIDDFLQVDVPEYVDVHGLVGRLLTITDPLNPVGSKSNLILSGHHGLGKSLLAANLAKLIGESLQLDVPMITYDCSEDTFELMLMGGSRVVAGGETPFIPGPFPAAIHLANEAGICVLCIEEISALNPGAQKVFNRITDWRRGLYVPDVSRTFQLKQGHHIIIIATMNPAGYGGVQLLNADLRSRFEEIEVPLPTKAQEMKILQAVCPFAPRSLISQAVDLATAGRSSSMDYSISTRDLVRFLTNYVRLDASGEDKSFALSLLANKFSGTDRSVILDRIDGVFSTNLASKVKALP